MSKPCSPYISVETPQMMTEPDSRTSYQDNEQSRNMANQRVYFTELRVKVLLRYSITNVFGLNLSQENEIFEPEFSHNKLHKEKYIPDDIISIKFCRVDQMVHSQNCWICRKISGKQPLLQSSKHLILQLCLAGKMAKKYIKISTLSPNGSDVRISLCVSSVNSDFSYCLTLNVPSLCFLLQANLYIRT